MRVCILGNSHAAALKLGWDDLRATYPHAELVFFASQAMSMSGLTVDGQDLVPSTESLKNRITYTSGGLSRVAVRDFDAFLVYSLGFWLPALDARLSSAVVGAALQDGFETTLNWKLCHMLAGLTEAPIFTGHSPLHARAKPWATRPYSYGRATEAFERTGNPRFQLLRQPAETLSGVWGTKMHFSKGSVRLETRSGLKDIPHGKDDVAHMNAAFGAFCVKALLSRLSDMPGRASRLLVEAGPGR